MRKMLALGTSSGGFIHCNIIIYDEQMIVNLLMSVYEAAGRHTEHMNHD